MALSSNPSLLATTLLLVALIFQLPGRTTSLVGNTNILQQNQALFPGAHLVLPPYEFVMQRDCNLVLYHDEDPLWSSNTTTTALDSCYFLLQGDGNGVIYNSFEQAVFATETWGLNDGPHTIILRSDGNVVMSNDQGDEIWQTYTAGR